MKYLNIFLMIILNLTFSTMINVPADQPTIQAGIDFAVDGDTVLVASGTYVENINFNGKNIVVTSVEGAENTIIDGSEPTGQEGASVVTFINGEDSSSEISGFTLLNGYGNLIPFSGYLGPAGSGIFIANSNPLVSNIVVLVTEDISFVRGGGVYCNNSNSMFKNISISNIDNVFEGAGFFCESSSITIVNSTIVNNIAIEIGGGICMDINSNLKLINSIIWGNSENEFSIFAEIFYTNIQNGWDGEGNIDLDPLFTDPENGDYTLQPNSPCIDAGTAFFVFEGDTLVNMSEDEYYGTAPDMGAFEFGFEEGLLGDVNNVGAINVLDIILVVNIILEQHEPSDYEQLASDVKEDVAINVLDVNLIV